MSTAIPGFIMLDPLIMYTWDTVGKATCESWCRYNRQIPDHGFHVVSALLIDQHWVPVWVIPRGLTLVIHLLQDGFTEQAALDPLVQVLCTQWNFTDAIFYWTPQRVPFHDLCGAAAIGFLGHLIVGAELPDDIHVLRDMHTNMKAGFVQAIFQEQCCRCPIAWGSGPLPVLTKALSDELAKHGVPESLLEQRSH